MCELQVTESPIWTEWLRYPYHIAAGVSTRNTRSCCCCFFMISMLHLLRTSVSGPTRSTEHARNPQWLIVPSGCNLNAITRINRMFSEEVASFKIEDTAHRRPMQCGRWVVTSEVTLQLPLLSREIIIFSISTCLFRLRLLRVWSRYWSVVSTRYISEIRFRTWIAFFKELLDAERKH